MCGVLLGIEEFHLTRMGGPPWNSCSTPLTIQVKGLPSPSGFPVLPEMGLHSWTPEKIQQVHDLNDQ